VLSQRFALDVVFGSARRGPFVSAGIACHMRLLASPPADTTYPSEPVLSDAAANFMYRDPFNLQNCLDTLRTGISSGLIHAEEPGEILSRLIILISRGWAAMHEYKSYNAPVVPAECRCDYETFPFTPDLQYFTFLRPVPLLLALGILFGKKCLKDCEETFKRAYISASHWDTTTRNVGPFADTNEYVILAYPCAILI